MYSYEFDCVISGTDAMWAQGWPGTLPEGFAEFSDRQLKYFAGGGFSLQCAALVQYTYWLNLMVHGGRLPRIPTTATSQIPPCSRDAVTQPQPLSQLGKGYEG